MTKAVSFLFRLPHTFTISPSIPPPSPSLPHHQSIKTSHSLPVYLLQPPYASLALNSRPVSIESWDSSESSKEVVLPAGKLRETNPPRVGHGLYGAGLHSDESILSPNRAANIEWALEATRPPLIVLIAGNLITYRDISHIVEWRNSLLSCPLHTRPQTRLPLSGGLVAA